MNFEIERKFLVRMDWPRPDHGKAIRQGYLSREKQRTVRIRVEEGAGILTIKGPPEGLTRPEFEYRIPQADAVYLLDHLCSGPLIEKTRYLIEHAGHSWEVDEFHGENAGLVVAEIELRDPGEQIDLPDWIDREVTGDPRYYNANLASHPYKNWRS